VQESIMEIMRRTSHLSGGNVAYIEQMYERYLEDPDDVPETWRSHFEQLPRVGGVIAPDVPHAPIRTHFEQLGRSRNLPGRRRRRRPYRASLSKSRFAFLSSFPPTGIGAISAPTSIRWV